MGVDALVGAVIDDKAPEGGAGVVLAKGHTAHAILLKERARHGIHVDVAAQKDGDELALGKGKGHLLPFSSLGAPCAGPPGRADGKLYKYTARRRPTSERAPSLTRSPCFPLESGRAPRAPRRRWSRLKPCRTLTLKVSLKLHSFSTDRKSRRSRPILNLQLEP